MALMLAASSFVCACASRDSATGPAAPPPSAAAAPSQPPSQTPPPKLDEVQQAVNRVFKGAALVDATRDPNFLAGDFNGDGSQDLAAILKPAVGKLSQMNEEFPPWIVRDPLVPVQPGMPPLRITATDVLLAVIHGYGPNGWRDPQATQTYLLKNAVGSEVKTFPKSEFMAANQGKKLPRLAGDSIGELLRGRSGYLYFAEATYSWYDPKTFKGEPEKRLIHAGATARTDQSDLLNMRVKRDVPAEK
jgi:hypothetical protein